LFLVKANWIVFRIFQHPLPKNKSSHFLAYWTSTIKMLKSWPFVQLHRQQFLH
jgi:hypothetical protein